jgi:hypothetical protein
MMAPKVIARELVYPLTDMAVIMAIIVFTLLNALASSAWLWGIWLYVAIIPAFFRYLLYLLEARANGRNAPVPGGELFSLVENFWSLFPLLLVMVIVWGVYFLATNVSVVAAIFFGVGILLTIPASMSVLAVTRSPLQSLNPVAVFRVMQACGNDYVLILMQFGLVSFVIFGLVIIGAPGIVLSFAAFYQTVLLFTFTGAILHAHKVSVLVDIPDAIEPDQDALEEQLQKDRQTVANHAYGFVSRGNRAGGLQYIRTRIDAEADQDDASRWFFNEMLKWESSDAALFFAQSWLTRLLYRQQSVEALKLVSRCLLENPAFRPLAEDRAEVIELAQLANHDELLRQLR